MTTIDIQFGAPEIEILSCMLGKTMELYKCDPFFSTASVFGIVGFVVGGRAFKLTNTIKPLDYFGTIEDVAIMTLSETEEQHIQSMLVDTVMETRPIGLKIANIDIINENQRLYHNGVQTYNVRLSRGIIFYFADTSELSFEKSVWFSEQIDIHQGEDLIRLFQSTKETEEDWGCGFTAECSRSVTRLSAAL